MHEKEHVIGVLQQTLQAIKKRDVVALKSLSNQTIHTASTHRDTDSITIAVIVYSIGKIIEKGNLSSAKGFNEFYQNVSDFINHAISSLKKDDAHGFRQSLESIMGSVKKLSPNLRADIQDIFAKAKINKASKIYEHGISMEQTANLLGITMYDLAGYSGEKGVVDTPEIQTVSAKERIKLAEGFFR